MAAERKSGKDRTSFVIAVALHVVLIGGVMYWAYKTGKLEQMRQAVLQYVKGEKKEEAKPEPVQQKPATAPKLPPINQGLPQTQSTGTRRAVASDAPAAGGDSFFQDTRRQVEGAGDVGIAATEKQLKDRMAAPAASKPPPPRPVFAPAAKTTIKQLMAERAKEAASVEAVGSEQISKTTASDASAVVSKVAGASIVDGKYAVIRGLSDRYVSTTFNGGEIPSSDPYRRSPSLDLFPVQVIDKVVITKTFTPDQPGTATGGNINIVSKSFPEKPFASVTFGGGYNTQATGDKDYLRYHGGSRDWLGMDDGSRELPSPLDNLKTVIPTPVFTTGPDRPTNPDYQANLEKADLLDHYTKLMGTTQFAPDQKAPPMNNNLNVAFGDTAFVLGRPFGVFGSLNYRREYFFYDEGISRRYEPAGGGTNQLSYKGKDARSVEIVNWGAMANLAVQVFPDHDVGFNYLFNQNGRDEVRVQSGVDPDEPTYTVYQNRLQYTERSLSTYQLKGTDRFPDLGGATLDWAATYSETTQDEPDTRFFNYYDKGGTFLVGDNGLPDPNLPTRYFRNLEEQNENIKLDLTIPFRPWGATESLVKAGIFASDSERSFTERQIYYPGGEFDGNPNNYLTEENLGYVRPPSTNNATGRVAYQWMRYIQSFDSTYDAESKVEAAYVMLDTPLLPWLRVVAGARLESTDLQITSKSYTESSVTGQRVNNTKLDEDDLLPALGLIITLRTNMNLRLNYSETIARPSIREFAAYRSYDPDLDVLVEGNPRLQLSSIVNYDARWEWFPAPGDLISVSYYYKDLTDAIERKFVDLQGNIITYENRPQATVSGFEFELRKNLGFLSHYLGDWSVGGNLALVDSEADLTPVEIQTREQYGLGKDSTRPLYDQSPYVLNLDLNYDNPRLGTSASLLLNAAGPRITVANLTTEDIYEQPPPLLDFVFSQRLGRNLSMKFTARNLLNPKIERTYGKDGDELYSSYKRGRTFGIAFTYDF